MMIFFLGNRVRFYCIILTKVIWRCFNGEDTTSVTAEMECDSAQLCSETEADSFTETLFYL